MSSFEQPFPEPTAAISPRYAGIWRRLGSLLIDYFLLGCMFGMGTSFLRGGILFAFVIAHFVISWLYCAGLEALEQQATIGEIAMGIQVADEKSRRISFARATGRFYARILWTLLPLCVICWAVTAFFWPPFWTPQEEIEAAEHRAIVLSDYAMLIAIALMILIYGLTIRLTAKKQTPHDMISRCVVLRK